MFATEQRNIAIEEIFWKIVIGFGLIFLVVVAFGLLHSLVETKTGYRPFTRQRLTLLSLLGALYHGAFYLQDHNSYLVEMNWALPAMMTVAAGLALIIIAQNLHKAGWLWGGIVTLAQSLIFVALGPMFAAMIVLFLFRGMTKNWGRFGNAPTGQAEQPNFLYPANPSPINVIRFKKARFH